MAIYRGEGGAGTSADTAFYNQISKFAVDSGINATNAAESATEAATSATAAATSETNAATSAASSAASASSAAASAANSDTSAIESATSAANALTSETNAASSATASASSATDSANSATASAVSATAALASQTAASTSETNAATSASQAASSASAASTSETNAATSASNASTSATNAATSATNAEAAYDSFDDRYLGAKASDPSVDNDGDALLVGALYWNTTVSQMKGYTGSAWVTIYDVATVVDQDSDTGAANLPTGTTAQRPVTPATGMFRFNATTSAFEGYNGSAWGSVGGASGGAGNPFIYENDITVTADYTITASKNGMSAGPITIADGVSVTIPTGSTWTVV